jgi:hypothetical protein
MKDLTHIKRFNESEENLNSGTLDKSSSISDVSDSSLNSLENAKKFLESFYWNIEEYDEGGYLGIDETELAKILVKYVESLK